MILGFYRVHLLLNSDDNKNMSDKEKKSSRKNSGLGLAIWILAFLILIIIFLVKSEDIKNNLQKTRFFERLFGKTPSFLAQNKSEELEKSQNENSEPIIDLNKLKKSDNEEKTISENQENKNNFINQKNSADEEIQNSEIKADEKKSEEKSDIENKIQKAEEASQKDEKLKTQAEISEKNSEKIEQKEPESESETKLAQEKPLKSETKETAKTVAENQKTATVAAKICFVAIDSDGIVIRKEVSRQVAKDSPLTASINSLLAGPTAAETKAGCRTLIPAGTKLYSAVVKNGVAALNFSEEIKFNPNGVEGYLGQFMQIVYTATNFSTVQSVQILIEGQKIDFLDDLPYFRIGVPLSKASFR